MKSIINDLAGRYPDVSEMMQPANNGGPKTNFETRYRNAHPQGENLTAENIRQAFESYKSAVRKRARTKKAKPGTVGPDRIPR